MPEDPQHPRPIDPPGPRSAFLFDPAFYLAANPDLAALAREPGFDPEAHFWEEGVWDGRDPSAAFDIEHLQCRLRATGRAQALPLLFALPPAARPVPNAWFNASLFRRRHEAAYPEIAALADYPLFEFYLTNAGALALSPNGLFDEAGYQARNPDVAAQVAQERVASGFHHFITTGWREGRAGPLGLDGAAERAALLAPGRVAPDLVAWFDADFYVAIHQDAHRLVRAGEYLSGLEHFLAVGREEGRAPHPGLVRGRACPEPDRPGSRAMPLADAAWLRGEVLARGWATDEPTLTDLLWDFVAAPDLPGRFDADAYLACNPDVRALIASGAVADAETHWRESGMAENRLAPFSAPFAGRRVSLGELGTRPPGVNAVAPFSLRGAAGDAARAVLAALRAAAVATYLIDVSGLLEDGARLDLAAPGELPFAITLFALPSDRILPLLARYGVDFFDRRLNLALWSGAEDRQALGAFDLVLTSDPRIAACTGRIVLSLPPPEADKPATRSRKHRVAAPAGAEQAGAALRAILAGHCGFGGTLARLGETLEASTPQSLTFGDHPRGARLLAAVNATRAPRFTIITASGIAPPGITASIGGLDRLNAALLAQECPDWEWRIVGAEAARLAEADARVFAERGQLADAVAHARGEYLLFLAAADRPAPDLLAAFAEPLATADLVYCDGDTELPDWSPETLLAEPYFGRGFCLSAALFRRIGGLRAEAGAAALHDLALRAAASGARIAHLARPLLQSTPEAAVAAPAVMGGRTEPGLLAGTLRPRPPITAGRASAIILSGCETVDGPDGPALHVERFFRSILSQRPTLPLAVDIVVDRGNEDRVAHLQQLDPALRIIPFDAPARFNFAAKANYGVRAAREETVILLNDDMIALDDGWAGALIEPLEIPGVAIAGARLLYPDRRIQHAGIALGGDGATSHIFAGQSADDCVAARSSFILRNVAAVTAACMAFRRADFAMIGGFDERFAIDYNDTDFCLRMRRAGKRVVCTPFATLLHLESQTVRRARADALETRAFTRRWRALVARDPYHPPLKTA